jgi:RHS repeat-associated protein
MSASRLCTYHYDPLDRLTSEAVATHVPVQRFYCKSRLATEIEGAINRSIVQHDDQLLALTETQGNIRQATLVASDQQRSVLQALAANESQSFAYSPYGHRPTDGGLLSLLGFNGQRPDPVTGHYLLGNGYRAFNPVLMRFNSPDRWSPFKKGGINSYAYCSGDPINRSDPNGTAGVFNALFQSRRLSLPSLSPAPSGLRRPSLPSPGPSRLQISGPEIVFESFYPPSTNWSEVNIIMQQKLPSGCVTKSFKRNLLPPSPPKLQTLALLKLPERSILPSNRFFRAQMDHLRTQMNLPDRAKIYNYYKNLVATYELRLIPPDSSMDLVRRAMLETAREVNYGSFSQWYRSSFNYLTPYEWERDFLEPFNLSS